MNENLHDEAAEEQIARESIRGQIGAVRDAAPRILEHLDALREAYLDLERVAQLAAGSLRTMPAYSVEEWYEAPNHVDPTKHLGLPKIVVAAIQPRSERTREVLASIDAAKAAVSRYAHTAYRDLGEEERAWAEQDALEADVS